MVTLIAPDHPGTPDRRRQVTAFGIEIEKSYKNHFYNFIICVNLETRCDAIEIAMEDEDRGGDAAGAICFTVCRQYLQLSKYFLQANDFIHQANGLGAPRLASPRR